MDNSTKLHRAEIEAIHAAIDQSKLQDEIVALPWSQFAHDELSCECESSAEHETLVEFWGIDCDGNTWRVHLHR